MSSEDQLEFNLGEEESETDVAIEQSEDGSKTTAEVVKNEPETEIEQEDSATSHREELETVSDAVQKRIAKLTARMREAERREQAAIDYAKGLQNQTQTLQQKLVSTDYSRLNETKTRLETQQQTLKAIIKRAREEGDIDTENLTFTGSGSATTTANYRTLRYTKVGQVVSITGNIFLASVSSQNGALKIPLPFANAAGEKHRTAAGTANSASNTPNFIKVDAGASFGTLISSSGFATVTVAAGQTYLVQLTYNT